jgi:hypothetical protein
MERKAGEHGAMKIYWVRRIERESRAEALG